MKKRYVSPNSIILNLQGKQMISLSGIGNSTYDIFYGGIDEDGNIDPSVKIISDINIWDDEW